MSQTSSDQRVVIGMMDGFGMEYYQATDLPVMKAMAEKGLFRKVSGVFPSVTNVNNVSIATSAWPVDHSISANSYFDRENGEPQYMNAGALISAETVFQRARRLGKKSALLSAKRKSLELFRADTDVAVAAEDAPQEYRDRYGEPGDIYSREINYWLWEVAADLLKTRPDLDLIYVHITDYPMHRWAPEMQESREHLQTLDEIIGRASEVAPDAIFMFTADHGMNAKTRCWDLQKVCEEAGTPVRFVLSPERDYYIVHHRNFTGCSWVWLNQPEDYESVAGVIAKLDGVEEIITGEEAVTRFHQVPGRLGDMVVCGDQYTMFGEMDQAYETLPHGYRAHGSLHEMNLPLIIYNTGDPAILSHNYMTNMDLASRLWTA
jgi:phosphonoacetate hydrolase